MYDLSGLVAPRALFVESGRNDRIFPDRRQPARGGEGARDLSARSACPTGSGTRSTTADTRSSRRRVRLPEARAVIFRVPRDQKVPKRRSSPRRTGPSPRGSPFGWEGCGAPHDAIGCLATVAAAAPRAAVAPVPARGRAHRRARTPRRDATRRRRTRCHVARRRRGRPPSASRSSRGSSACRSRGRGHPAPSARRGGGCAEPGAPRRGRSTRRSSSAHARLGRQRRRHAGGRASHRPPNNRTCAHGAIRARASIRTRRARR